MAPKQPVVVLVPGASSVPAMYKKLVDALEAKSFAVHVPALPTNNGTRPPNSSHADGVAAVREVVKSAVDGGNDVIVIMHPYGGVVGTSAVEGLSRTARQANGLPGGAVHLVYLSAYLLVKGQSVWKVVEETGLEDEIRSHLIFNDDGTWLPNDPVVAMFRDPDSED